MADAKFTPSTTPLRWLDLPAKRERPFLVEAGVFFACLILVLIIDFARFSPDVEEGRPAKKTITAPKIVSFTDQRRTNELRRAEEEQVPAVLTAIDNAEMEITAHLETFLEKAEKFHRDHHGSHIELTQELVASYFNGDLLLETESLPQMLQLTKNEFNQLKLRSRRIIDNVVGPTITTQNISQYRNEAKKQAESIPGSNIFRLLLSSLVCDSIKATALLDENATRQRREAAANAITPVKRVFQKGEKIIDEGVVVTADDMFVLRNIEERLQKNRLLGLSAYILLVGLLLSLSLAFLRRHRLPVLRNPEYFRLTLGLWLCAILFGKLVFVVGDGANSQSVLPFVLSPLPAVALLLTLLLDASIAMFHVTLMGILMFVVAEANARFALVGLLGGIIAVLSWSATSKDRNLRATIGWSGVKIGVGNAVALLALLLLDAENYSTRSVGDILTMSAGGFANGIVCGILANGVLPYIESFFSLATSSRLLELADLSQPLMRRLAEEAPGTYQHSLAVASLAAAAATEINADSLLAKIGAYYHDIGKLKRPSYFAENQQDKGNQHDQLTPYMSSLILVGHIRDGLDIAREYSLPERVIDLISQHHGTTLISYFYEQAKSDTCGQTVSEERFRYPGPKPQTKEAAIVMLADSVEAASRTLQQVAPSRVEALVQKIFDNKREDENQLDESDLTLKELERIQQVFVKVLTSMYHGRVDYPGKLSNQPRGGTDGSSNQQPAKEN